MGFSDRSSDSRRDHWLRWLWIPILLPGMVLAWLAWRAVVVERRLLERQLTQSRERLADQVAGTLSGAGREVRMRAQMDLERWVMDVGMGLPQAPPPWFDAVEIRTLESPPRTPSDRADSIRLESTFQAPWEAPLGPDERLSRAEDWLLLALHAADGSLPADLSGRLERLQAGLASDIAQRPHWRGLIADQVAALRRRAVQAQVRREAAGVFDSLARSPLTRIVQVDDRTWQVLAPPDLPRGTIGVGRFSEGALRQHLLRPDLVAALAPRRGEGGLVVAVRDEAGNTLGRSGGTPSRAPDVLVPIPGGFPAWSVAVWSSTVGESEARSRSLFLSALLGLCILILAVATTLASRSIRIQRQLLSMKTDFIGNVSHELKTPLTSIAIYSELLSSGRAGSRAEEFGGTILREARRLQGLIEGLLTFARDEAGAQPARKEPIRLDELVREAVRSFQPVSHRRGILLEVECSPCSLVGDPSLVRPVVDNLVDNAFKYGREGGYVHVQVLRDGDSAVLRIRDDGQGIPEEDLPNVFDRFYRGGGDLTRSVSGTGLGLAIVRRNVEIHGGEVVVRSRVGSGTTFEVRFPATEVSDA